jgi:hypothetical protein
MSTTLNRRAILAGAAALPATALPALLAPPRPIRSSQRSSVTRTPTERTVRPLRQP